MAHKQISRPPQRAEREDDTSRSLLAHPVDTLRDLVGRMESFFERPMEYIGAAFEPTLDIEQTPKELVIRARLPGYSKDDISVDLTEDSLTLRGSRRSSRETRKHGGTRAEYTERSFVRSVTLLAAVRTGEAKASFKGERLEIRLPRAKETQVRRLDVD